MSVNNSLEIVFKPERCKKCAICIELCPQKVLTPAEDESPVASYPQKCSACRLCEYRCPDFAILIRGKGEEKNGRI